MEHCHKTGKFRNIVCTKCNHYKSDRKPTKNNTGERYISKIKHKKYTQGFCFEIKITRNDKKLLQKQRKTIEDAIEVRDKFLEEHPEIFT